MDESSIIEPTTSQNLSPLELYRLFYEDSILQLFNLTRVNFELPSEHTRIVNSLAILEETDFELLVGRDHNYQRAPKDSSSSTDIERPTSTLTCLSINSEMEMTRQKKRGAKNSVTIKPDPDAKSPARKIRQRKFHAELPQIKDEAPTSGDEPCSSMKPEKPRPDIKQDPLESIKFEEEIVPTEINKYITGISAEDLEIFKANLEDFDASRFSINDEISDVFDKTMSPSIKSTMNQVISFVKSERFQNQIQKDTVTINMEFTKLRIIGTRKEPRYIMEDSDSIQSGEYVKQLSNFELLHLTQPNHSIPFKCQKKLKSQEKVERISFEQVAHALTFVTQCENESDLFPFVRLPSNSMDLRSKATEETRSSKMDDDMPRNPSVYVVPTEEKARFDLYELSIVSFLNSFKNIDMDHWKPAKISALIFALCRLYLDQNCSSVVESAIRLCVKEIFGRLDEKLLNKARQHFVPHFMKIAAADNYWAHRKERRHEKWDQRAEAIQSDEWSFRCLGAIIDHFMTTRPNSSKERLLKEEVKMILMLMRDVFRDIKYPNKLGAIAMALRDILTSEFLCKNFDTNELECYDFIMNGVYNQLKTAVADQTVLKHWISGITNCIKTAKTMRAREEDEIKE